VVSAGHLHDTRSPLILVWSLIALIPCSHPSRPYSGSRTPIRRRRIHRCHLDTVTLAVPQPCLSHIPRSHNSSPARLSHAQKHPASPLRLERHERRTHSPSRSTRRPSPRQSARPPYYPPPNPLPPLRSPSFRPRPPFPAPFPAPVPVPVPARSSPRPDSIQPAPPRWAATCGVARAGHRRVRKGGWCTTMWRNRAVRARRHRWRGTEELGSAVAQARLRSMRPERGGVQVSKGNG
jgi:hypothetical protein